MLSQDHQQIKSIQIQIPPSPMNKPMYVVKIDAFLDTDSDLTTTYSGKFLIAKKHLRSLRELMEQGIGDRSPIDPDLLEIRTTAKPLSLPEMTDLDLAKMKPLRSREWVELDLQRCAINTEIADLEARLEEKTAMRDSIKKQMTELTRERRQVANQTFDKFIKRRTRFSPQVFPCSGCGYSGGACRCPAGN